MGNYPKHRRNFFRIERINYDFPALFEMLYAADRYEVTYRLKGSKNTLKTTLLPATWGELKSRVPEKEQETSSSDYSFKILGKENTAIMDFRNFNDPNRMKVFADSMFTSLREKGKKILLLICETMVEGIPKLEMFSFVISLISLSSKWANP